MSFKMNKYIKMQVNISSSKQSIKCLFQGGGGGVTGVTWDKKNNKLNFVQTIKLFMLDFSAQI